MKIGVVSDTHVPDRAKTLHPTLIDSLRDEKVSIILHGGDISCQRVLSDLEKVAPVYAALGNRDAFLRGHKGLSQRLEIGGKVIALMHGHGEWLHYIYDKFLFALEGYRLERYLPLLLGQVPDSDVVVFGHTHVVENMIVEGKLLFNPGPATTGNNQGMPSYGILNIERDGNVRGEVRYLKGYSLSGKKWKRTERKNTD